MAGTDWFLTDEISKEGIELDEYKGQFQLIATEESKKDGKTYQKWAFPQTGNREPASKAIPMRVVIGDRATARKALWHFLQLMGGPPEETAPDSGGDVPF